MRNPDEIAGQAPQSSAAATPSVYRLGDIVIDAQRGYIRRPDSEDLYVRHQTFQVLLYLLTHRDQVVSKEDLRRAIWGDVAVTDDAFVQCVVDIRKALGDDSREQRIIKTLPRKGYRFVGPVVQVAREDPTAVVPPLLESPVARGSTPSPRVARGRNWRGVAVLAVAAVMIGAIVSTLKLSSSPVPSPETVLTAAPGVRRVVVFYFENQSGTPGYEWLRHGFADMVITGLSRSESVAVLSRQQLELLLERNGLDRDRTPPLDRALELARQSGADSVVLGSFGEIGGALRFDARIHDAKDGRLLGSESAVSQPDQLLTDGDLLALRVGLRLGVDSRAASTAGRLPEVSTTSLEAYRIYLMGLEKAQNADAAGAIRLFEDAIKIDPQFAMAYARVGFSYAVTQSLPERAKPYLRKAFENASRLSDKDRMYILVWSAQADLDYPQAIARLNDLVRRYPLESEAWRRLGVLLNGESRADEARVALQRGLVADPFDTGMLNSLGSVYHSLRRPDDAIAVHRRFVELAPHQANAFDSLGLSYQFAGRYDEAIDSYRRALTLDPSFEVALIHLGNTFFQLGRYDEAVTAFRQYIAAAEYDRDRARGHASIAWVEWRRRHEAAAAREIAVARGLSSDLLLEAFQIDFDRGQTAEGRRALTLITRMPNRGRRVGRRIELFLEGQLALHDGRTADALALFEQATTQPSIVWAADGYEDCLAAALLKRGSHEQAIAEYDRLLTINPNLAIARFGKATALDRSDRRDEARREYQSFLEIWRDADADVPELRTAQERLSALGTDK